VDFSYDRSYIAAVDLHNEHNVHVYNNGNCVFKQKGDTNKIHDVCFSKKPGSTRFATAGVKHIYFWDATTGKKEKGLFGSNEMTSFACVTWDADECCYTGGSNGCVYKWEGRECAKTLQCHKAKNFISSINWVNGKLYSGAKDNKICVIDTSRFECVNTIEMGSLVRAIDCNAKGQLLVGCRNGDICVDGTAVMKSHCDGEVWGLSWKEGCGPVTSADDNKVMVWDCAARKCVKEIEACCDGTKTKARRGGASSTSKLPSSCQSRAVAVCGDWIAIACNDGRVSIRKCSQPETQVCVLTDSTEWVEVMAFSPDGSKLAVGSHDNNIYVYDAFNGFSKIGTCKAHNSYVMALDWSADCCKIRSNCGAYELLFFDIPDCVQDKNGRSNTTGTVWATQTVKFGWHVEGIYPKGTDGTHINGVCGSHDGQLLVTADDYGLVCLFRDPCRPKHQPRCFRGHSEHVVRACFSPDDGHIFSIGGLDQTLMQWKKK